MKKIFYLILIAGAFLFASSCQRDGALYEMPDNCALVSFPSDVAKFSMVSSDGNKITLLLNRGNTKGAVSIPITVVEDKTDGLFKPAKNTFDFADGEAVATLDIKYPDINQFGGETYEMTIAIEDESQVSPAGYSEVEITAQRQLTYKLVGSGTFYSVSLFEDQWEQDVYTTVEAPDYYILPDCYSEGYDVSFTVKNGVVTIAENIDTGVMYDPDQPGYGTFWLTGCTAVVDGDTVVITCHISLPAIDYDFGGGMTEAFEFPTGVLK